MARQIATFNLVGEDTAELVLVEGFNVQERMQNLSEEPTTRTVEKYRTVRFTAMGMHEFVHADASDAIEHALSMIGFNTVCNHVDHVPEAFK